MRYGGFADLLTLTLVALVVWALTASGGYRAERRQEIEAAAAGRVRRDAGTIRVCASLDCPEIRTVGAGDRVVYGRSYGYRWWSVEVTDQDGRVTSGAMRTPEANPPPRSP